MDVDCLLCLMRQAVAILAELQQEYVVGGVGGNRIPSGHSGMILKLRSRLGNATNNYAEVAAM
eukprot:10202827-Karenia_brevis.AAC.1